MTTSEELSKTLYSDNTQEFMTLANSLATEGTTESVDVLLACFEDDDDYYDDDTGYYDSNIQTHHLVLAS